MGSGGRPRPCIRCHDVPHDWRVLVRHSGHSLGLLVASEFFFEFSNALFNNLYDDMV